LPYAREAGFQAVGPLREFRKLNGVGSAKVWMLRPRPDKTHLSSEDVEELRQLIDV
jgi:hypothetical protein